METNASLLLEDRLDLVCSLTKRNGNLWQWHSSIFQAGVCSLTKRNGNLLEEEHYQPAGRSLQPN